MCSCRNSPKTAWCSSNRKPGQKLSPPGCRITSIREVAPVLSPLALDPARPFPKILNKSLNFAVVVEGEDGFGRNSGLAVVQAPRSLPRLIRLPDELGSRNFVFLGTIVEAFVSHLFSGMTMRGCYQFRVTRNSDLFVEQEEVDDLLRAVEGELASRRYGDAVRLETAHDCPEEILSYLLEQFALSTDDLYKVSGPVNLNRLMAVYDLVDRTELKYAAFAPSVPEKLKTGSDLFATLRAGDVLLLHPYQGFGPVTDFIKQAAADPQVLAIKQTLYRGRQRLHHCWRPDRSGGRRQGRHRHHRVARTFRRRSQHRACQQTAGSGRARHVRRVRIQNPCEIGDGGAA